MVWTRAMTAGRQQGTPLVHDGVMYMPNPNDVIQAIDAVSGDLIWEHVREKPEDVGDYIFPGLSQNNRNIAIHGTFIIDTSVDDHLFALDAATGRLAWETQVLDYRVNPAMQGLGSHHRRRQGDLRAELRAEGRAGRVRHHGPRRADRGRAVAPPHHSRAGRAGRRDVGRRPLRRAQARRRLDGAELRPRAEPHLHRDVGHVPRPEVPAGRHRPPAPLPQLHAGARRRHRRDRVVLPAHERVTGTSTIPSSACWWIRRSRRIRPR